MEPEPETELLLRAAAAEKPHRLCLYLPSRTRNGSLIPDFEKKASELARLLCTCFGGVTSYPAAGHFAGEHGIIPEAVLVVEFYCARPELQSKSGFIMGLVWKLREELEQETMALAVDGTLMQFPGTAEAGARH